MVRMTHYVTKKSTRRTKRITKKKRKSNFGFGSPKKQEMTEQSSFILTTNVLWEDFFAEFDLKLDRRSVGVGVV